MNVSSLKGIFAVDFLKKGTIQSPLDGTRYLGAKFF